jgi:transglutaminase-like putative cysteine protease
MSGRGYRITHRTEYRYPDPVSASFGQVVLLPRERPGQRCERGTLHIEPPPRDLRERRDFFGNRTSYFAVLAPHTRLEVTATSEVRVPGPGEPPPAGGPGWEDAVAALARPRTPAAGEPDYLARQFVLASPRAPVSDALAGYVRGCFPPGRPLAEAAVELISRIHRDFEYLPGATAVGTTVEEVLDRRAGVCQDFAHLAISCLRSLGLAARYVSGYLETRPPPGRARLLGADVSHAWLSVYLPGTGWLDLDPTNDKVVDDRYVTTAWGRDYADVAPLKGVIFTDGDGHELRVSVDVLPLDDDEA